MQVNNHVRKENGNGCRYIFGLFLLLVRKTKLVEYSDDYRSMILFKHPRLPVMKNIYVLPFHRNVWVCCVGLFFLCFGLLLAATLSYPGVFEAYTYSTPTDILTLLIGVASQQGKILNVPTS